MGYLPFFSAETWTLLAILISLLVVYGYMPYGVFEKLGIPGPKPSLFWGTILKHDTVYYVADWKCSREFGKMWGLYELRQPMLAIMDPGMIKTILVKECYSHFTNHRNFSLSGELYDAINFAEDEDWRRIRTVLSPSFTSGRIKEMFEIMKDHSSKLADSLRTKADNEEVIEPKKFFGSYSMDVIVSTSFSIDIDSLHNPNDPFVLYAKDLFKINIFLFLFLGTFPALSPLLKILGFRMFPKEITDFFHAALEKIKSGRQAGTQKSRVDFLQLMMDSQKGSGSKGKEQSKGLSDHEILSQAMMFIFAGYETTSSTLSLLAYNLATNPDIMTKLQEEIDTVFPNKAPVQYEALMQMDYLDSVINESLRLYPVAPRLERVAKKTVEIKGITIPKGSIVMIPIYALHRDPDLWPDPEQFKPERFSKQNKESIDPYTYMPFGMGPRNCIGMRLALVMVKLALVEVLQKFSFATCERTEIPFEFDPEGILSPKRPIKLQLLSRSKPACQQSSNNQLKAESQ